MASVTFPVSLGGDGSTVTDDASPTTGLANGGHRTRFVPALSQMVAVANGGVTQSTTQVGLATTQASNALASANAAAASAASALSAPGTSATSTTSLAIGLGSKSLTLAQTGKSFVVGQWVSLTDTANPTTQWMKGAITAFNSGTGAMTVSVVQSLGSGTIAAWTVVPTPADDAGITATSTTSVAIGTGSKSLTLAQTSKGFVVGQWVSITDNVAPDSRWMLGPITAFNSTTGAMTVNVTQAVGTFTGTAWNVSLAAPAAPVSLPDFLIQSMGII
jgi:hypothetical protein